MKRTLVLTLMTVAMASCATANVKRTLTDAGLKMPSVKLKDFDIKGISLRDIDLVFNIEIANPYPIELKLENVTFKVDVEKKQVFTVTTPSGFTVKAKETAVTPLVLNLEYAKIIAIIDDFRTKDVLVCDISGELSIPLPKMPGLPATYKVPFKVTQKIPAIMPSITVENVKFKAPSQKEIAEMLKKSVQKNLSPKKIFGAIGGLLSGKTIDPKALALEDLDLPLQVDFDIKLKNNAKAKLVFDKLEYDFTMNGEAVFGGNSGKTRTEGDTLIVSVQNILSSKKLGASLLKLFKERKGTFKVHGGSSLNLPLIRATPIELKFEEAGNFGL